MTNQEINEAVARKLHPDPTDLDPLNPKTWDQPWKISIPDYCHSIEAAWEVVDYCQHNLLLYQIDLSWSRTGSSWYCAIGTKNQENESIGADTASMAICLAFLKLEDK